jgi:hypothetical protein
VVNFSRNGNLQLTQHYYGASQPSELAALVAGALFYGQDQDTGFPRSTPTVLQTGDIRWNGAGGGRGDGSGVATDQTGSGTVYEYQWPCCGGEFTDFFRVNGVARTQGLVQQLVGNVDPQWPLLSPAYTAAGVPVGNFAVNPFVRSRDPGTGQEIGQVIISSNAGRIFGTVNNGLQWLVIGEPTDLDSSYAPALAYGSPQGLPGGGTGSLNSFLYAGTVRGNIFVTFTGGGAPGSGQWINLAAGAKAGDLANNTDGVLQIIPSPVRDSREVYAVTTAGVFHLQDSSPSSPAAWRRITGNLFALLQVPFGGPGVAQTPPGSAGAGPVPLLQTTAFGATYLTSLQVDWRYTIPDAVPRAGDPSPTHPVLYVAGLGGVFRSLDDGGTWTAFPSADAMLEGAVRDGGYLPVVRVSDLDLAVGPIEPTTGRPGGVGPGVLLATTYGRGSFAIRVGPTVIPNTVQPGILALDAADRLGGNPLITANPRPTVTGVSQQSDPGLPVTVNLFDAATGTPIGTGQTDFNGNFRITLLPFYTTPGLKTIAVQATDQAGIAGNVARLTFFLENASPLPPLYLPDLAPDSDTGRPRPPRDADDLTNLPLPSFQGTLDPGATVEIFVNGVLAGTGTADATGFYRVTLTVPLAEGPNVITLREIGAAGDVGPISPPITVTLDTVSPTPIIARLLPTAANDTGPSAGDNVTGVNRPTFVNTLDAQGQPQAAEAGALVQIFVQTVDAQGQPTGPVLLAGEAVADAAGLYSVRVGTYVLPAPTAGTVGDRLPDGAYLVTTQQLDVAGNLSQQASFGASGTVIIDGTDANEHGFFDAQAQTNQEGWRYIEKALNNIGPNVTNGNRVIVALGATPSTVAFGGAGAAIYYAFRQSNLPALGWSLVFIDNGPFGTTTADLNSNGRNDLDEFLAACRSSPRASARPPAPRWCRCRRPAQRHRHPLRHHGQQRLRRHRQRRAGGHQHPRPGHRQLRQRRRRPVLARRVGGLDLRPDRGGPQRCHRGGQHRHDHDRVGARPEGRPGGHDHQLW